MMFYDGFFFLSFSFQNRAHEAARKAQGPWVDARRDGCHPAGYADHRPDCAGRVEEAPLSVVLGELDVFFCFSVHETVSNIITVK